MPEHIRILHNPSAGQRRAGFTLPARARNAEIVDVNAPGALEHLDALQLLVIHGGDGTAARVLTRMYTLNPQTDWPAIALLPAGTTNMTASDINRSRSYSAALQSLLPYLTGDLPVEPQALQGRRALRIECAGDVHLGFFLGLGAVPQAVAQFGAQRGRSLIANRLQLVRVFARSLFLETPGEALETDGCTRDAFAAMATTLDRLIFGLRPYSHQRNKGSIAYTCIPGGTRHLWRHLPALYRGTPARFTAAGFHSREAQQLTLRFTGAYTIDGELFHNAAAQMNVTLTGPLPWLTL